MSKGTPIITLRLPPDLDAEIQKHCGPHSGGKKREPYRRSSWIIAAIREKLAHLKRSKKRKKNVPDIHSDLCGLEQGAGFLECAGNGNPESEKPGAVDAIGIAEHGETGRNDNEENAR